MNRPVGGPADLSGFPQIRRIVVMNTQVSRRRRFACGGVPIARGGVPAATEHGSA